MASDDDLVTAIFKILFWFFVIAIVLAAVIIVVALIVIALIGLFTLKMWSYDTEWAERNQDLVTLFGITRKWENYVGPGIVWITAGFLSLLPAVVVSGSLNYLFGPDIIERDTTLGAIVGITVIITLIITLLGPFPIRYLRHRRLFNEKKEKHTAVATLTLQPSSQALDRQPLKPSVKMSSVGQTHSSTNISRAHEGVDVSTQPLQSHFICPKCSKPFLIDMKLCGYCGTSLRCEICKHPLRSSVRTDALSQCFYCESWFHYSHLLEWVRIKGNCPMCRKSLSMLDVKEVK